MSYDDFVIFELLPPSEEGGINNLANSLERRACPARRCETKRRLAAVKSES